MAVQPIAAHKSGRRIYLMSSATQVDVRRSGLFYFTVNRDPPGPAGGRLQRSPELSAELRRPLCGELKGGRGRNERDGKEGKGEGRKNGREGRSHKNRHSWLYSLVSTYMTSFWATVRKTVRPVQSDRCMSVCAVCPVLSVTLVYCDQTVEWIIVKLGMQVDSALPHCLRWDQLPIPQKGTAPISVVAKWLDGLRCHLV